MIIGWQDALVATVVLIAAGYVAVRVWRAVRGRKSAGCGGCGTCPSNAPTGNAAQPKAVLQIDPPARS